MKVALVHDYLDEFGGAERVLLALSELYPEAPIFTAYYKEGSVAYERFKDKTLIPSFAQKIPFFAGKLHSPLRFIAPYIWESFDFDDYDVVISSASWYITKGIITRPETLHVCYCHTPPRYLYGFKTSVEWQRYWPIRWYAYLINGSLREYDFLAAQRVDVMVTNSENTRGRIRKFYRRDARVIYPPVELPQLNEKPKRGDYYLIISRIVGGKGLELAVEAATKLNLPLKVVGQGAGWSSTGERIRKMAGDNVSFLGYVDDVKLSKLYSEAKAFLALAEDEDFGITPVEAMMAGTPVIAYAGGGYLETVKDGKSGLLVKELTVGGVIQGMRAFETMKWDRMAIQRWAHTFSKERFLKEVRELVTHEYAKLKGSNA